MKPTRSMISAGAFVLAAANAVYAQETPAAPPPPATVEGAFTDAFTKGKFSINARLRYELAEDDRFADDSHAFTIRPRFGFTTAPVYGLQGMIEGEHISVIGPRHNFNAAGSNGQPTKPIVADPPSTEINQAWLGYSNWNSSGCFHFARDFGTRPDDDEFRTCSLLIRLTKKQQPGFSDELSTVPGAEPAGGMERKSGCVPQPAD